MKWNCQGECNFFSSVLITTKIWSYGRKAPGTPQLSWCPCYSFQTDQFYLENKGMPTQKTEENSQRGERQWLHVWERRPCPSGPSFHAFPPGSALCNRRQGAALFHWGLTSSCRPFLSYFHVFHLVCFLATVSLISFSFYLITQQNYISVHYLFQF